MSRDLFGFKDEPFSAYPDNKYFFSSILHDKAITLLEYGLHSRKGFMLLTGLKGTGKTMTCNILKDTVVDCNVSIINYENMSPDILMQRICEGFGLNFPETDKKELFGRVMEYFVVQYKEGRNNLIIVDNAENISNENLETLNDFMEIEIEKCKLVQVVLSGCPELHDRLKTLGSDLGPKFTFTVELAPLNLKDTTDYVEHRLKTAIGDEEHHLFKKNSYLEIYNYSKGIPSEVNRIAHKALSIAKDKKQTRITSRHIKMAAARLYGVKSTKKGLMRPLSTLLMLAVIVGGVYFYKDQILGIVSNYSTVKVVEEKAPEAPAKKAEPVVKKPAVVAKAPVVKPPVIADNEDEKKAEPVQPKIETPAAEPDTAPVKEAAPASEPVKEKPVIEEKTLTEPAPEPVVVTPEQEINIKHGCITAQSGLKIRAGASVNTELTGTAPFDSYIELYELSEDGKWWKTKYNGSFGYMYSAYIKVVDTPEECGN